MGASFENLDALNNLKQLIPELESISSMLSYRSKIYFIE